MIRRSLLLEVKLKVRIKDILSKGKSEAQVCGKSSLICYSSCRQTGTLKHSDLGPYALGLVRPWQGLSIFSKRGEKLGNT